MPVHTETPRLHVARSRARLADGSERQYAYLRYEVWDERKKRYQPKPLASLGRTDRLDEGRLDSLEGFLKEWLRKDSSLPFEALQERFKAAEPALQILCSRDFGLRWVFEQAWEELGYKDALAELAEQTWHEFRVDIAVFAMVLVQLVAPQSKRGLSQWKDADLFFPEGSELEVAHFYKAMDVLSQGYEHVEQKLKERLDELGVPTTQLSHDTTTISFAVRYDDEERAALAKLRESQGEAARTSTVNDPPLRMRGHSKSKRRDLPQVVLEAVVGEHGLVVHHRTHAGNTNDSKLTPETLARLRALGFQRVEWVGDSGTNSVANRQALRASEFEFVLGEGVSRTKVVKEVLKQGGGYRQHPEKPELSYKCVLAEATDERKKGKQGQPGPLRLYVIRRNSKEAEHALRRIEVHLAKVEKVLSGNKPDKKEALLHHRTYRRYVRPDGRFKKGNRPAGRVVLDRKAVARARFLAGKSVIATDARDADPVQVDRIYRRLFEVEHIFRQMKSTLRVGPIRHRRADRIQAHVMIGVMATNLGRWLEHRTGETLESLQRLFRNLRVQQVSMGDATYWQCVELEESQKRVLQKLGYELPPRRFTVSVPDLLHQVPPE